MAFVNLYTPPRCDPALVDISFAEPYDLNSSVPVPSILETSRVQLVPFIPSTHAKPFHDAYIADPNFSQFIPRSWPTLLDFLLFLEIEARQDPSFALFAIIDKSSTTRLAGIIGWLHASTENLALEIGPVIVLPEFQRTHVSANAIGLLLKYVLDTPKDGGLGYRRVVWCANPLNKPSVEAAEKMGFKKEGITRWSMVLPEGKEEKRVDEGRGKGDGRDSVVLSLCWDDWVGGAREAVIKRMERIQ